MRKLGLIPILFYLLISLSLGQVVTIGVQPAKLELDFYKADSYKVEFRFFNERGDTNATYVIDPNTCSSIMKDYPKEILVPVGTKRLENPVTKYFTFVPDYTGNKNCSFIIYVKQSENNVVSIRPQVAVSIEIFQPLSTTQPPSTQQSSSSTTSHTTQSSSSSFTSITSTQNSSQSKPSRTTSPAQITNTTENTETRTLPITQRPTENKTKINTQSPSSNSLPPNYLSTILPIIICGAIGGLMVYIFRDKIFTVFSKILPLFALIFLTNFAYGVDVNITVNVTPTVAPPITFYSVFPIGTLVASILLCLIPYFAFRKYVLEQEFKLNTDSLIKILIIFSSIIIFVTGLGYVFTLLGSPA